MNMINGVLFTKRMIKLLKEFNTQQEITPDEFLNNKFQNKNEKTDFQELYENFVILMKHHHFFELVVREYWSYYGLKNFNAETIITLMYIIIFMLDETNCQEIVEIFTKLNYNFCFNVVEYFTVEDNITHVVQAASRMFDNEYVLENILKPLLNKQELLKNLYYHVGTYITKKLEVIPKPLTKPNPPSCFRQTKVIPSPPLNTPTEAVRFVTCGVPKNVLDGDLKVHKDLQRAREQNKEKALKLLEIAQKDAFKCATIPKKVIPSEIPEVPVFRTKKVPPMKEVVIKKNTASLMREAATLIKDKESEIKKIEALSQAVFDPTTLDTLENDIRKFKEQQNLQDIERKHLQGQLTYEEAILAKRNLVKVNQEKYEKFKEERVNILEEIDRWRQKEQEKIKTLVERCHNIEKAAKDAGRKVQENKKLQARLVETETRELLKEAYEKKQKELACRVRLIQELRALQQVRSVHIKEFDPTESPHFGFLCEMSIAELQERLGLLKMELQEELKRRKKIIAESRQKQQKFIESVKQFIGQSRVAKPKLVPRSSCKLEQTPEIITLRERLQQARYKRISNSQVYLDRIDSF